MKIKLIILTTLMACCLTISHFAAAKESKIGPLSLQQKNALAKIDILACLNNGSIIKAVCLNKIPTCVEVYMDAGKTCTSSNECSGVCRLDNDFVDSGVKISGFCSVNSDDCGCFQQIKSGIAQPVLCTD